MAFCGKKKIVVDFGGKIYAVPVGSISKSEFHSKLKMS
jgi:hypothetical protein